MLSGIQNIAGIKGANEVKLQSVKIPKALPRLNSFVKVEVLENVKGNFKILINGSLFQSKLPVKVKAGDILFAQIISHNPVTIALNNFALAKTGGDVFINLIFSKLGLKKTAFAKKFVEFLIKSKKTISKEKIKELSDFFSSNDLQADDFQFAFISAYFYEDGSESFSRKRNIYVRIFDMNFTELNKAIFKTVVRLSSENLDNYFYDELRRKLLFDYSAFVNSNSFNGLFGKVKNSIEFAEFIEKYLNSKTLPQNAINDLSLLKEYLIKYVLQKSLLNKYGLYRDFAITLSDEGLHLWEFEITHIVNSKGEKVSKIETFVETRDSVKIDSEIFIAGNKIQGGIKYADGKFADKALNELNATLAHKFSVEANITGIAYSG